MTLIEALNDIILPPAYSLHLIIYQNSLGDQRAKIEFKKGKITLPINELKETILEILPEAHYQWFTRNNSLYGTMTQCDHNYTIITHITNA